MNVLFVLCGIVVSLVLVVAGGAKLRDRPHARQMLVDFGLSRRLAPAAAISLPVLEIGAGLALLVPGLAPAGALLALLLLASYNLAIVHALLQGRRPACNCFGQAQSAPISWATALRNGALTACAAFLAAAMMQSPRGVMPTLASLLDDADWTLAPLLAAGLAVVALQAWINVNVVRQQGRLLLKIDNLEYRLELAGITDADHPAAAAAPVAGGLAPAFSAPTLDGGTVSLGELLRERTLAMVFVNADCKPCASLLPELERFSGSARLDILLVTSGARQANIDKLGASSLLGRAAVQDGFELNDLFGVIATPSALCIGPDGTITSGIAVGQDAILELLVHANQEHAEPTTMREIRRHAPLLSA